jgi:DNA-binding transcriptional LysR family regulator
MAILVTASDLGSLSAAGRKLGVPLPSVSRKISDLEAHLKTQLLVRTTRKLSLTEAGVSFVASSRRILEQVAEAERGATGAAHTLTGELTVTAPIVFGRLHLLPVVCQFLAQHPQIDVRLSLSDSNAQLIEGNIDVALRIGALPDSSLQTIKVGTVRRVVCASPAYLAAHGVPKGPADLGAHAIVAFAAPAVFRWTFRGNGTRREQSVAVHPRLTVNTAEAALDAAIASVGLTRVLSYQAADAVARGKLKIVLQSFEPPPVPVSLVHPAQSQLPRKTRVFLDFAAEALRKRLVGIL